VHLEATHQNSPRQRRRIQKRICENDTVKSPLGLQVIIEAKEPIKKAFPKIKIYEE